MQVLLTVLPIQLQIQPGFGRHFFQDFYLMHTGIHIPVGPMFFMSPPQLASVLELYIFYSFRRKRKSGAEIAN